MSDAERQQSLVLPMDGERRLRRMETVDRINRRQDVTWCDRSRWEVPEWVLYVVGRIVSVLSVDKP